MPKQDNPWDIPEWHSIRREAALVRHLVGSGATALGRASYADKMGEYYTAFFGLSVGLERLAKLILVADFAISNGGTMPAEKVVRQYGHKLANRMDVVGKVAPKHSLKLDYPRPTDSISAKIVECLDSFADASRGRYANFAALGDPNLGKDEPIRMWWSEVAELILKEHYYGKPAQERVEGCAKVIDALMSPVSLVLFIDEAGDAMQDVLTSSIRTGQTELVQRYGRYHALTVVRWLSEVFSELTRSRGSTDAFYGVWEYFQTYTVEDAFLKTRKNWPLT
jgi:hypothetical protein